jgi:hypothetical protein
MPTARSARSTSNRSKSKNGVYSRIPTQAWRAIPIPGDKKALNAQVQASLRQMGSVWQYYELIDTQWPTEPNAPPSAWDGGLPDAVTNKPAAMSTPVMLTNITMETYFQKGNQPACNERRAAQLLMCCPNGQGRSAGVEFEAQQSRQDR